MRSVDAAEVSVGASVERLGTPTPSKTAVIVMNAPTLPLLHSSHALLGDVSPPLDRGLRVTLGPSIHPLVS